MTKKGKASDALLKFIYPRRCACCNELINYEDLVCKECDASIRFVPENRCLKCGQEKKECECHRLNYIFSGIVAPFYNQDSSKKCVYGYKFNKRLYVAEFLTKYICRDIENYFDNVKFDCVCQVPMTALDSRKRDFDHSAYLAKSVAANLGLKFDSKLLKKVSDNKPQHKMNFSERPLNVKGVFAANKKAEGKMILLIDDIKTTGATLNECTKQLLLAGAKDVYCAAALIGRNRGL
ncbi:MAG: double zinc ribbon domain-containing protein [Oscillospiraceae bacterium]|nr:double zinc ribbon domain-containing protein [Oscillospiraceae bacterium]